MTAPAADPVVEQLLRQLQDRIGATSAGAVTVDQLYRLWEKARGRCKSWNVMRVRMAPVREALGSRPVMLLRPADWAAYVSQRRVTPIRRDEPERTYKDLTINQELGWMKAMCNWGVELGHVPYNPISVVKPTKTKRQRDTAPVEDDITKLLKLADPVRTVVVLCAADSGMRRNEICQMRWDWVNESARIINIPGWATKNSKPRTVPMTARTWQAIRAMPKDPRCPNVLVNPNTSRPFGSGTFTDSFRQLSRAAGIQAAPGDGRVRLHDLRHGWASQASRRGVRLDMVSKILGHATIQQTLVYVQLSDDDMGPAIDKFEIGLAKDLAKTSERAP
jgi:integrase